MDYVLIRQIMIPPLLEVLKTHDFNWDALEKASLATSYPYGIVRLAFKDSLDDVLKEMALHFENLIQQSLDQEVFSHLRTHEKIRRSVELTFQVLTPYKEPLRHCINKTIFIHQLPTFLGILYDHINDLWYRAGDQATDYNFYTKRLLLSVVFVPTFSLWMKKESDLSNTMAFFDKRLGQVMKIPTIKKQIFQIITRYNTRFKK